MDAEKLNQAIKHRERWTPRTFICKLCDEDGTDKDVDLMKYLPKVTDPNDQYNGKATVSAKIDLENAHNTINNVFFLMQDERLYFKTEMKDPKDVALHLNKQSCIRNNYILTVGRTAKKPTGGSRVYIMCSHGRRSRKDTSSSMRPETVEEQCPFKLLISNDDEQGQWYMRKNAGHCLQHVGHIEEEPTKKIITRNS